MDLRGPCNLQGSKKHCIQLSSQHQDQKFSVVLGWEGGMLGSVEDSVASLVSAHSQEPFCQATELSVHHLGVWVESLGILY